MGKYVGLYDCQVHMGCQEEICIIASSLEEAEKYIEDGYSSYMVSWEYTAMDTWRARIEEEEGEEPEECEDFYESQECEDFWSDGYFCACVERHDYKPVNIEEAIKHFQKGEE